MESQSEPAHLEPVASAPQCLHCGQTEVVPGYPNPLCASCRTALVKFPVPLWVKAFGGVVAALFLYALIHLPGNLKAGIALARAEKAEERKNYVTEQAELQKVLQLVPQSVEPSAHMLIASYYNIDFQTFGAAYKNVESRKIDNESLFRDAEAVITQSSFYFSNDTLNTLLDKYKKMNMAVPDTAYNNYLRQHPEDVYARLSYANKYFQDSTYAKCDILLSAVLKAEPDHLMAMVEKSIVKRELKQLDSSLYYCDLLLSKNHQSLMGLSSKSRTLMKKGDLQQGLQLAEQCKALDKDFYYNTATLAIAYHLTNRIKDRDVILQQTKKDTMLNAYMSYANDIISGKVKFN